MAYVDPTDAVSGTIATAADFNVVTADIRDLNNRILQSTFMGVFALRSANLALTTATYTAIPFTTADSFDVGSWHAANSTDIIVPSAAIPSIFTRIIVRVDTAVRFAINQYGVRRIRVLLNGSVQSGGVSTTALNGDYTLLNSFTAFPAVAADVITVEVYQGSGSTINADGMAALVSRLGSLD